MRLGPIARATSLAFLAAPLVAQTPSPPGRLVDVGGQRLHVNCTGTGSPTVIFESGTGDASTIWALVQPRVSAFTRACSYDRAGYAWSDPGRLPRTFAQLSLELHTALCRANVAPPYVLVGQSYGGLVVRGFAERYPDDVAGMVLVDAAPEDHRAVYGGQPHRIRDEAKGRNSPPPRIELGTDILARAKTVKVSELPTSLPAPLDRLPADAQSILRWAQTLPVQSIAREAEMEWSPEEAQRMHDARLRNRASLGNLPLAVLARGDGDFDSGMSISADSLERERRALQRDLARLSTRGTIDFVPGVGHNIHVEAPRVVIDAIRRITTTARAGATARPTPRRSVRSTTPSDSSSRRTRCT